jgi:hypothetical protein
MACENNNCDKCACDDKNAAPEIKESKTLRVVPKTVPEERVVYVDRESTGFWTFFWGFLIGSLFFGC